MNYETVFDDFSAALPEKGREIGARMKREDIEAGEGMHVVFSEAILPLVLEWVAAGDPCAERAFTFFDSMADSEDVHVGELLDFTVLEFFADLPQEHYAEAKKLMSKRLQERCADIEEYLPGE